MHPYAAKRIWFALARTATAEDAYVHWADDDDLDCVILITEINKIWLMTFVLRLVQMLYTCNGNGTHSTTTKQKKQKKKIIVFTFWKRGSTGCTEESVFLYRLQLVIYLALSFSLPCPSLLRFSHKNLISYTIRKSFTNTL